MDIQLIDEYTVWVTDGEVSYRKAIYEVRLSVDKPIIKADGQDTAIITAKIYNYLDEFQENDSATVVIFQLADEQTIEEKVTNGMAQISFSSAEPGEFYVGAYAVNYGGSRIEVVAK